MLTYEKVIDGIYLVQSDTKFTWSCQGILIKDVYNCGNILIDCNFPRADLKELLKDLDGNIHAYFATHAHLDHVNHLHHLEKLIPNLIIYCPVPEDEFLLDMNKFIDVSGAKDFDIEDMMRFMIRRVMKFKEVKSVIGFEPGDEFNFGELTFKTIHLPGHSPGHVAFIIKVLKNHHRKILFATDVGIEDFGTWYGFKNNNLKQIREDIKKLEEIYLNDDYILVSSHGQTIFEKNYEVFKTILNKIMINELKVLEAFDKNNPKGLEDIALKGIIYKTETIQKYLKINENIHKIWFFYESGFLLNHINELVEKGKLIEIENMKWILNKS